MYSTKKKKTYINNVRSTFEDDSTCGSFERIIYIVLTHWRIIYGLNRNYYIEERRTKKISRREWLTRKGIQVSPPDFDDLYLTNFKSCKTNLYYKILFFILKYYFIIYVHVKNQSNDNYIVN